MAGTASTPSTPATTAPSAMAGLLSTLGSAGSPMYNPTTTNTSYLTQTSPQDITSLVNATMQQLVGRNATAQEIQQYGAELLQAERANQGSYTGVTTYGETGKRNTVTGQQTTTGVDATAFLQNLISGSADAKSYRAATGYFDGMIQALQAQKAE